MYAEDSVYLRIPMEWCPGLHISILLGSSWNVAFVYIFMRLTPDSRAPAYLGLGTCRAGSCLSLSLSRFETWWSYLVRILALGWAKLRPRGLCWAHLGPKLSLC